MDKLLLRGRNEKSKIRWSGATSVTCIIENIDNKKSWIHIANCGNFLRFNFYRLLLLLTFFFHRGR